jgi:hypothetical protein
VTVTTRLPRSERRRYWEQVARAWGEARPHVLWRAHSDAVNARLVARWLPESQVGRLLKTDALDEAVSDGLYPQLATRARRVVGIDISIAAQRAVLPSTKKRRNLDRPAVATQRSGANQPGGEGNGPLAARDVRPRPSTAHRRHLHRHPGPQKNGPDRRSPVSITLPTPAGRPSSQEDSIPSG